MDAAKELGATTVAMPALSTGVFGYPLDAAAEVIASERLRWVDEHPSCLSQIQLVDHDSRTTAALRRPLDE